MTLRLRSIWDVRAFSVTMTALVMLGSLSLQAVLIPPDLTDQVLWPATLISYLLAAPVTHFIGLRLHEIDRLNTHLRQALRRDALTGLLNRHAFLEQVTRQAHTPGVIIMADIDHFKLFNDTHGHALGDAAIIQVAQTLRSSCRAQDLVARFGGEEFMLFLPDTQPKDGHRVAERLRWRLTQNPMSHDGETIPVTASFGVATLRNADDIEPALARADAALYEAKNQGRNRVNAAA